MNKAQELALSEIKKFITHAKTQEAWYTRFANSTNENLSPFHKDEARIEAAGWRRQRLALEKAYKLAKSLV